MIMQCEDRGKMKYNIMFREGMNNNSHTNTHTHTYTTHTHTHTQTHTHLIHWWSRSLVPVDHPVIHSLSLTAPLEGLFLSLPFPSCSTPTLLSNSPLPGLCWKERKKYVFMYVCTHTQKNKKTETHTHTLY